MAETWRVVLATGEVREVEVRAFEYQGRHICWTADRHATGESKGAAVVQWARNLSLDVREILAPGEPTRAELTAQLAAVTAERDAMRRERDEARAAALEECAARCDEVAKGADDALIGTPAHAAERINYLKGRRRGAELCAETIRTRATGGE